MTEFFVNTTRIARLQKDPFSTSGLKNAFRFAGMAGSYRSAATIAFSLITIVAIGTIALLPSRAQACSLFDIFSCFVSSAQADVVENMSSQSVATALQAVNTPEPQATTSTPVSIVSGALLAAIPQSGSTDRTRDDDQISLYVVHAGDTLPAIAKMFGVTANTIIWGNDLQNGKISVGQTLVILPVSGVQHVVKSGDTVQSIARQHKGDINEIMQYNGLSKDAKLAVGDIVIVPDGEIAPTTAQTRSTSTGTKYSNVGVGTRGPSVAVYDGYYMRPIIGGVKTQGIHGHNAVDLASSFGSNIYAAAAGTVIIAKSGGWNGGYGSYIAIAHDNGTQTLYGHLSDVDVAVGDSVSQGQVIGHMGATGHATGVHLHFEIRGARNPF